MLLGALFFCGYELSKSSLQPKINQPTSVYMVSASIGAMVSNLCKYISNCLYNSNHSNLR